MPYQSLAANDDIFFQDGVALEFSNDGGSSYTNLGVLAAGTQMSYQYDKVTVESGNRGTIKSRVKNETISLEPSALWSWNVETWSKFSGTLFNYSAIAGSIVNNASQVVASGDWAYNKFILIENQNYDAGAITVDSVTAGTNGLLVEDTDYYVGQNESGLYGVFIIDSATVTTLSQSMTIVYDYTPSTGKKITAGTSSTVMERGIARIRHYTDDALTTWDAQVLIYGVELNAGISWNFKGTNEDGVNEITVGFTGNIDTSRTSGAQLFEMTINNSALTDS